MAGRRVLYGAALLAALGLFVFYDGYLALFLLAGVVALPLLSLALSLPTALLLRVRLAPSAQRPHQGEEGWWLLEVTRAAPLPPGRLTLRLSEHNLLTGSSRPLTLRFAGLSAGRSGRFAMDTGHCGALECRAGTLRLLDCLGLFSLPVHCPGGAQALVLPRPAPEAELPPLDLTTAGAALGRSTGMGQDYELREYRPGDPIRSIHWKLSSKRDILIVREPPPQGLPRAALTFDHTGTPEELDRVLGRLWSLSGALLRRGILHRVGWRDREGTPWWETVASFRDLEDCMDIILSHPAGAAPSQPLDPPPGTPLHIHIPSGEGGEV